MSELVGVSVIGEKAQVQERAFVQPQAYRHPDSRPVAEFLIDPVRAWTGKWFWVAVAGPDHRPVGRCGLARADGESGWKRIVLARNDGVEGDNSAPRS